MTTSDDTIRIGSPDELLDAIPYLLGFHPTSSLVLVGIRADGVRSQVRMAMRIDLTELESIQARQPESLRDLVEPLGRGGADEVMAFVLPEAVTDDAERWRAGDLVSHLRTAAATHGLTVADVVVATADRWWSLTCSDRRCCPRTGRARSTEVSAVAARATVAGLVALADREALIQQLAGQSDSERQRLEPAIERAEHRALEAILTHGALRRHRADRAVFHGLAARVRTAHAATAPRLELSDREIARMVVALTDTSFRDEVWTDMDDRALDATDLVNTLHRLVPAPYDAAPLFLYGWACWRKGNGLLAALAAEAALRSDPDYSAARLLLTAVHSGMNPHVTPRLSEADETHAC